MVRIGVRAKSVLAAAALAAGAAVSASEPSGDRAFLPAGAKLEALVDGNKLGLFFVEGPAVTCDGAVLFSDINITAFMKGPKAGEVPVGSIMKYDPKTRQTSFWRSPSGQSNGLRIDRNCDLYAAEGADFGGQRVTRTDMKTGRTYMVTGHYNGRPYNGLNDVTFDSKGRIYFSDAKYMGHEPLEQALMAVYRIDADGKVAQIVTDVTKPNGIAICPGDKHLFVAAHDNGVSDLIRNGASPLHKGEMALVQYDLDAAGNASKKKVLVNYAPDDGPDGVTCDADGDLWVAVRSAKRPGIYAYRVRDGKAEEKAYIPTGKAIPSNMSFGRGADASTLYITAGNSLFSIRTAKKGYHLQ